jgi:hypothetical protein
MTEYLFSQAIANSALNNGFSAEEKSPFKTKALQSGFELQIFVEGLTDVKTSLSLVDLQGRNSASYKGIPEGGKINATFNTQNLSKGIYVVNIQNGARQSTLKVMVR